MIRYLFSAFVVIHGLIHFIGFANAFRLSDTVTEQVSRPAGIVWLIAAFLFVASGFRIFAQKDWWIVGFISLAVSQVLIIFAWSSASWGTLANGIILVAACSNFANWQFRYTARNMAADMLRAVPTTHPRVTETDLSLLPQPVSKWLVHSGALHHEMIYSVRLRQQGSLRMDEDASWLHMTAEQYFRTDNPAFLWVANIKYGLTHIAGRDVYDHGKGNMVIKAASTIPVANAKGPETDQGTMLRYLAEIQWFPSAALSPYITWHPVDSLTAIAEMSYKGMAVKGTFHFNNEGDITAFEALRYMERKGKYSLETWYVPITAYREFNGIRVPAKGEAIWKLKTGDFNWFNWEITAIDYNCKMPYRQ